MHDDSQLVKTNPLEVNVVVETVVEISKEVKRIANKGSKEIISESDLNERDQKKICTNYIRKGKDLSKLKAYLKEQKEKPLKKQVTSRMVRRKRVPTKKKENKSCCKKLKTRRKLLENQYQVSFQRELSGKPIRKPKLNFKQNWKSRKNLGN